MKFNRKILATALMTALASLAATSASAALTSSAGGDSSLVLYVWNDTDGEGVGSNAGPAYVRDLGILWSTINTNKPSWNAAGQLYDSVDFANFAGDSTFSSLFSSATSTLRWGVYAANSFGGAGGGAAFVTVGTGPGAITSSGVCTSTAQFDTVVGIAGVSPQTGNSYTLPTTGPNWIGQQPSTVWGFNAGSGLFGTNTTAVGTGSTLKFYELLDSGSPPASINAFQGLFSLSSNGSLMYQVAAIPEPETYALLASGLVVLGALARRRKA